MKAKAKINLFLHITGKAVNNYHLLESLVVFADDVYDYLEVTASAHINLQLSGDFASALPVGQNIVEKAAKMLQIKKSKVLILNFLSNCRLLQA